MRKLAIVAGCFALLTLAVAAPARAQAYIAPSIGYDFGGDAGNCRLSNLDDCSEKRTSYGLAAGALAGGVFGFEEELAYAPDFFGASDRFGDNSMLTLMSNLVVSLPLGPIRPYATAGLGLMRTRVTLDLGLGSAASQNALAYDVGAGVMILLPGHLGVRGDVRRFKSTKDFSVLGIDINNTKFAFSRASAALVLHW